MNGVPAFSMSDATRLARDHFGVDGTADALPSERDQNVAITSRDGSRYVLKIANANESASMLDAESAAMHATRATGVCPAVVHARDGAAVVTVDGHLVRLITAVPGVPLGRSPLVTDELRRDVGRAFGAVDRALERFDHTAVHRSFDWDLERARQVMTAELHRVVDPGLHRAVVEVMQRYDTEIAPHRDRLRRRVIHSDGNDFNILVDVANQRVTGVIDFGDMVASRLVYEPAIAMAYIALGADDPLAAAAAVLAGYHESCPLDDHEIAVVFPLVLTRLAVSVCMAARQLSARPNVAYLGISQGAIARVLPQLLAVHPRFAHYTMRAACGRTPVPACAAVVDYLRREQERVAPLLGVALTAQTVAPIDLSVGSPLVSSRAGENAPAQLDERIHRVLADAGVTVGAGGYGEARLIYAWAGDESVGEPRTIHMGIDLSVAPGTPLFAPLDGVVHSFEDAAAHHDYGPVIVLRHETDDAARVPFFVLYGHLTRDSLDGLRVGDPIARGAEFARVGSAPTNGDWWAHVHVQLITDMLDVVCNVDGVVRASQRTVWASLCPDPNLLLGIPASCLPTPVSPDEVRASRHRHQGRNLSVSYGAHPLTMVRGAGAYLYDSHAHRHVDAYNNVAHVGHAHPRVVRAVSEQLSLLNTNTRYLQSQLMRYTEALLSQFRAPLDVVFFTASGSEANELALRLARSATRARDLVVMDAGYHGHTTTLIDISPYKHDGPGGEGAPDWVHTSPIPDVYRAQGIVGEPGPWFAERVGDVIDRITGSGRRLCGYIAETCPSVGGQIIAPPGFLRGVYERVRAAGGVCIADEVQTGFGRLGTHFWGYEAHDVLPDIVVLGKPIANGYPIGAVVTTRAIADAFDTGMEYFSTFGGSTAACVAALTTLQVTLDEGLQENARRVGDRLLDGLRALERAHPLIGDVRGSGLFLGVELVRDHETRAPAAAEADRVVQRMRARRVLAGTDGPFHNVIKLRGPMPLSLNDADRIVDVMAQALREVPAAG
jgi:4-aminobutyrate aminotransferase-like enzyme/Ser/Thr protein kinase RdoA (MazF antagonist)/murein DD-endopeptidase MepM/ murein hydrolase activator NlpD